MGDVAILFPMLSYDLCHQVVTFEVRNTRTGEKGVIWVVVHCIAHPRRLVIVNRAVFERKTIALFISRA